MAPTQTNRLDDLEEVVAALQGEVPELRESMEDKFKELRKFIEENQAKGEAEQNRKLEETAQEQRNIMTVLTTLVADVKVIHAKLGEKEGEQTPISNPERSTVEQSREKENEIMTYMEGFRQTLERNQGRIQEPVRRLEFPIFSGDDPDGWVSKAERYFDVYQMPEREKLGAAILGLEGDALAWFQWENKRRIVTNWRTLRRLLLKHFRGRRGGSLIEIY